MTEQTHTPTWIDAHNHLHHGPLAGRADDLVAHAASVGVTHQVVNGMEEADWGAVADLARRHAGVVPCFGLHPWWIARRSRNWRVTLERHLDAQPAAIGECGLDAWIEPRDAQDQEAVLREHLAIARERRLPVMIHCLRAWDHLMAVLASEPPLPAGFLLHAYGGPPELICKLAEMGACFSFAPNALEGKRVRSRQALRCTPEDRLLLETDAPDMLAPPPHAPHALCDADGTLHNTPANLAAWGIAAAEIRGTTPEALAALTNANARRFLGPLLR